MQQFRYVALDASGARVRGYQQASSPGDAAGTLERRGLTVLHIRRARWTPIGHHLNRRDALLLATSLAPLLAAGLPITRALDGARNALHPKLHPVIDEMHEALRNGQSISTTLKRREAEFGQVTCALIGAGEAAGDLTGAFRRAAMHLERGEKLRERLKSATTYPALLVLLAGMIVGAIVLFVLPNLANLLDAPAPALPTLARATLAVSGLVIQLREGPGITAAALLSGIAAGLFTLPRVRMKSADLILRAPGIRIVHRSLQAVQCIRSTGVLLQGGVPLLTALRIVEGMTIGREARDAVRTLVDGLQQGEAPQSMLGRTPFWPPLAVQLVAIGEDAAALPEYLLKAADLVEADVERRIDRYLTLLEPALILAIGAFVALTALAVLQTIYGINAAQLG